jgi:farnesyl-diphosphate farnesyltransferase
MDLDLDLNQAMSVLKETSRTFYIPISRMNPVIKEAVASAYLCMRALDEIEDHPRLPKQLKVELLSEISLAFHSNQDVHHLRKLLAGCPMDLPGVTIGLPDWFGICPDHAKGIVAPYTAKMAELMAGWAAVQWRIHTENDLDRYTYSVAGLVGEMLSELWLWYDGTHSDRSKAVAFGRGLQAVNIIRNRGDDRCRGVDFFPDGWKNEDMIRYARKNLKIADEYVSELRQGPALEFCRIPLALAHATVRLIESGGMKLSRANVMEIVESL